MYLIQVGGQMINLDNADRLEFHEVEAGPRDKKHLKLTIDFAGVDAKVGELIGGGRRLILHGDAAGAVWDHLSRLTSDLLPDYRNRMIGKEVSRQDEKSTA